MNTKERRISLINILFLEFIDYAGIAIVYPLFAYILFDPSFHFLPEETSNSVRGLWLGILIAIFPLLQLIFAPIFGALSDLRGRKKILKWTLVLALVGYAVACLACALQSLLLLAVYRMCVGIAAGNSSVISAIVADLSTTENKAKNYGLLNMAFGAGFTIGPFLGGSLAHQFHLSIPFLVAFFCVAFNLILTIWKLKETSPRLSTRKVSIFASLTQLKQAAMSRELRLLFLGLLIFSFGWSFFTEFASLYLIQRYQFEPQTIGLFYAYTGFFYALSAGFLIYPFIRRMKLDKVLFLSMLFSGLYLWLFIFIDAPHVIWIYLPVLQFFLSFVYPAICSEISNRVTEERQGEAMGMYQAVIALALAVTPLCSGFFIGKYPILIVLVSGLLMVSASFVNLLREKVTVLDMD